MTANFILSGDTAILWYQQPDSSMTIGLFKQHLGYVPPVDWPHLHALRQRSNRRSIGRDDRLAQGAVSSAQKARS